VLIESDMGKRSCFMVVKDVHRLCQTSKYTTNVHWTECKWL